MAMLGKKIRMSRLIDPKSNKMLAITVDHSISRGIMHGLIPIQDTIDKIVAGEPNAITMTKGIAELCMPKHVGKVSLLLKSSSYSPAHLTRDVVFGDVEEAVRMGADAISIGAMLLGDYQAEQVEAIGRITKEAMSMGMPVIGHIYPKGESVPAADQTKWENIAYCCRVGAELGIDIIKTTYTGDPKTMEKVVAACPARVVIQGGDVGRGVRKYMQMTWEAMNVGVSGVTFGRFVWEYRDITALVKALKFIIHENGTVDQAHELLAELENEHSKNI